MGISQTPNPGKYNTYGDQSVSITNPTLAALGISAAVTAYGAQRVTTEPAVLLSDPFDGAYDPMSWILGGTVVPTFSGGRVLIEPGTAGNASSSLTSIPSFTPPGATWLGVGMINRFEFVSTTPGTVGVLGRHRFFGFGTIPPTTWNTIYGPSTTTGPLLNGYGFEIDVDGDLYACIYDNGTRYRADAIGQAPGVKRLTLGRTIFDGELHQFTIAVRPDAIFWYIDGLEIPAAIYTYKTAGFPVPDKQTLPLRLHTINSSIGGGTAAQHRPSAITVADTGSNNLTISDGIYGWKEANVTDVANIPNALRTGIREQAVGNALNVNTNAVQLATYKMTCKPTASALTAGTLSFRASLYHLIGSTKTVRIRSISVTGMMSAVIEASTIEIHYITAAPSAGTAVSGRGVAGSLCALDPRDPAPEAIAINNPTVTSVGLITNGFLCYGSAAAIHGGGAKIYDWQESGSTKPITLRAGVVEGIAIGILSNGAVTPTLCIEITFTEE